MSEQKIETKYVNLSKKYKIDRDDFEAQFERLTRYILQTYNFGTELVTLAFLELIRNGDIPGDIEAGQRQGAYRRAPDEDQSAAENAIKKPSEMITSAIRAKAAQGKQGAPGETGKTEAVAKQLEGQLNIFDEKQMPGEEKAKGEHYVDYIATREGVEIEGEKWKDEPATKEQKKLVNRLIADFPDCKDSFEYQDYLSAKTKYTATEFIDKAIEENVDRIGKKENYIGYIAMRPRVEKSGAHGLFSYSDEPIKLSKVAKEVGNHDGIVWTTVISLRREDAEKLGYDNLPAWKTLLRAKSQDLANAMGVPITDMKWYAAFHNESGHPHVHLVSYSTGKEPYMTRQGFEKLKAAYAHEIFKNDLYEIYEKQTEYRDELRTKSKEKIAETIRRINDKNYENETLELMLKTLAEKLQKHKGKKV